MKFSVTKTKKDSALPVSAKPDLILIYADDVKQMPITDDRKVFAVTELQLHDDKQAYSLYLTSADQAVNANTEGDTETRGWVHQIAGNFPGTGLQIAEWLAANINSGFVAMRKHCSGTYKIFGSKYNPLFFTGNIIEDKDKSLTQIEFKQTRKSKVPYIHYNIGELNPENPDIPVIIPGGGYGFIDLTQDF